MNKLREEIINKNKLESNFKYYVLGIDLGGTNLNLCIAGVNKNKAVFLIKFHFYKKNIDSIIDPINKVLSFSKEKYNIEIKKACIGVPGIVSSDKKHANLTNISWNISSKEIIKNTNLEKIILINDFQCIGYGFNCIDNKDIIKIKSGKNDEKKVKSIVGAGSGLGKAVLIFDKESSIYKPLESEGGHSDFPVHNKFELDLNNYVKIKNKIFEYITYEELLSGKGLENIYLYISNRSNKINLKIHKEILNSNDKASIISKYKKDDENCKLTFELFTIFYARCLKNFALDTLSKGGIYIAGGIAIKNKEIFENKKFIEEFESVYKKTSILKDIPVYLILNYDISLYGACIAAIYLLN